MNLFRKLKLSGEYCVYCGRPTIIKTTHLRKHNAKTGQLISRTYIIKCPKYSRYVTHSFKTIEKEEGSND